MIVGLVNAYREAVIRLRIYDMRGQSQEIEVVVDTGFMGRSRCRPVSFCP